MGKEKIALIAIGSVLTIVLLCVFGYWLNVVGIETNGRLKVREERVRREVYEETKSYNEGKIQDLVNYRHQWKMADAEDKLIIENTVRMMFADYSNDELDPELQKFLKDCKY